MDKKFLTTIEENDEYLNEDTINIKEKLISFSEKACALVVSWIAQEMPICWSQRGDVQLFKSSVLKIEINTDLFIIFVGEIKKAFLKIEIDEVDEAQFDEQVTEYTISVLDAIKAGSFFDLLDKPDEKGLQDYQNILQNVAAILEKYSLFNVINIFDYQSALKSGEIDSMLESAKERCDKAQQIELCNLINSPATSSATVDHENILLLPFKFYEG